MHVFPLYAALLAIFFAGLSVRTLLLRRRLHIALGDAGNATLLRAIRAHSNFAEHVPICLILLATMERQGASVWSLHVLGTMLILGRVSHAFGVSQLNENFRFHVTGMVLTLSVILVAACVLLIGFVGNVAR